MSEGATHYGARMSERYDEDFVALFGGHDRGDLGFFRACAAATEGPVCEVGAGTGRVVLALAEVTGRRRLNAVEPSDAMRAGLVAKLPLADPAGRVRVLAGDFLAIPLRTASQGFAYAAFRSFQHVLEVEEQLAGLEELRRVLRRGGLLALDLFDPVYALLTDAPPSRGARYRTRRDTIIERWESRRIDRVKQRVDVTFRWIERTVGPPDPGRVLADETATYGVRYTFPHELQHLLARAGFRDVELRGGYDGRALGQAARELVVTARKP